MDTAHSTQNCGLEESQAKPSTAGSRGYSLNVLGNECLRGCNLLGGTAHVARVVGDFQLSTTLALDCVNVYTAASNDGSDVGANVDRRRQILVARVGGHS